MNILKISIVFFLVVQGASSLTFENYIKKLYPRFDSSLQEKFKYTLKNLHPSDKAINEHRPKLSELLFLHMLFTTTDAVNGRRGGILQIPYFWHWSNPNPRHEIIFIPEGTKLNSVSPPAEYGRYKSYADIDRTPFIYLQNLMEEGALFNDPVYGTFYTFGWCSEREMAFASILNILGYNSKVKQEGIHVWTEVLLSGVHNDYWVVKVDNTFNGFQLERLASTKGEWQTDFGEGTQVQWYNKKAHSKNELYKVKSIEISETVKKRIDQQIYSWIKSK